jgi:hypothetical protein
MTRAFVSPMGDPTFANATASLADAFFPSAKSNAQAKLLGAQYQDELASGRQHAANADQLENQNAAIARLADVFTDPQTLAILQAGLGNSDQMAGALGKRQEMGFRDNSQAAVDRGDMQSASNALIPLANGPLDLSTVQDGVRFNKYREDAPLTNTPQTLAEIVTEHAQAGAYGASANSSNASAEASRARAAFTEDKMAHPEKYRTPTAGKGAGAPLDISPSDTAAVQKLILSRLPAGAKFDPADIAATTTRFSELYQQSRNAGTALDQAFKETLQIAPRVDEQDNWGWSNDVDAAPPTVSRRRQRPPGGLTPDQVSNAAPGSIFDAMMPQPAAAPTPAGAMPVQFDFADGTSPAVQAATRAYAQADPVMPPAVAAPAAAAAPAPTPKSGVKIAKAITEADQQKAIDHANDLIKRGGDEAAIRARLEAMGVHLK